MRVLIWVFVDIYMGASDVYMGTSDVYMGGEGIVCGSCNLYQE